MMQKIENRFKENSKLGDWNFGNDPDSLLALLHGMTLNNNKINRETEKLTKGPSVFYPINHYSEIQAEFKDTIYWGWIPQPQ